MIHILTEEIKTVAGEKIEFEDRDEPTLVASFGIFGLTKTRATEQKKKFFNGTPLHKLQFPIETCRAKNYSQRKTGVCSQSKIQAAEQK